MARYARTTYEASPRPSTPTSGTPRSPGRSSGPTTDRNPDSLLGVSALGPSMPRGAGLGADPRRHAGPAKAELSGALQSASYWEPLGAGGSVIARRFRFGRR